MCHCIGTSRIGLSLLGGLLVWAVGCQQLEVPAFDPTGERIFSPSESLQLARMSDSRYGEDCLFPQPAWQQPLTPEPCPEPSPPPPGGPQASPPTAPSAPPPQEREPGSIMLNPTRMIAPVGSEVVIVGGLCGETGRFMPHQPIEFMLSQDSVGQFVAVNDQGSLWCRSKKLGVNYAIARTANRRQVVTRGTPSVTDDVVQQKGQCWVSLTSASQGTSYITAVAPKGASWPQRRKSATIYWVDAQWAFPDPDTVPAGEPYALTTSVKRTATGAPVADYIVRYEIVDGAPATLGPDDATVMETRTDDEGLATVELRPTTNQPGVTQVRIKVIRPADPDSDAPRTLLGEGYTSITWSAPGLALHATGPPTAVVGSTLVYRLQVRNPGDIATRDVVVRGVLPPGLKFVSSEPAARIFGNRAEWRFAELPAQSTRTITVNVRAEDGGSVRYSFEATSGSELDAKAHVDTEITRPTLALDVSGPQTATVGDRVQFRIEVSNTGERALEEVRITDRFDTGLRHADGLTSPIQKVLGDLDPGQTKEFAVTFVVQRAGEICHQLEVTAPGGQGAQTEVCLTASEPEVTPEPKLEVRKRVKPESRVGENVQVSTLVTNTGNVPLTEVRIVVTRDPELAALEATEEWDEDALEQGQLQWTIEQLDPGETVQRDVLCLCREPAEAAVARATVTTAEDLSETAEARVRILPEPEASPATPPERRPSPTGQLKVDISKFGDPVRIDDATRYLITIQNDRNVPDQNVVLKLEFPPGLQFQSITGPQRGRTVSQDGRTVTVSPIREIRAGETLQPPFRVEATGVQAGEQTLRVTVTSRHSPQGVTRQEVTTVVAE
ncbi:MAG: DUF7507 domain-containing protein [Planctomycetota bacterium]